jgi:hypothetical protein
MLFQVNKGKFCGNLRTLEQILVIKKRTAGLEALAGDGYTYYRLKPQVQRGRAVKENITPLLLQHYRGAQPVWNRLPTILETFTKEEHHE